MTPLGEVTMSSDRDALATLATVSNEVEAQLLVNLLEEHGIVSTAIGGFTSDFRAEAPGAVRVVVKQDNLAAAESVLADANRSILLPSRWTTTSSPPHIRPS